ncbi:export s SecD/SecF fusion domain protein, partial [Chlamydia psittaci 84-8471/1]
SLKI